MDIKKLTTIESSHLIVWLEKNREAMEGKSGLAVTNIYNEEKGTSITCSAVRYRMKELGMVSGRTTKDDRLVALEKRVTQLEERLWPINP